REHVVQTVVLVERAEVLDLVGFDVVGELSTGVRLERVRRVVRLQSGCERVLRVRARATGDGRVDELRVGVLLAEHLDERVEARLLGSGCPPREHLDLAGVVRATRISVAAVARVAGAAGEREWSDPET